MSKMKTKKLSLKKETLRTLNTTELGEVAGGTTKCYSGIRPPPPGTFGCETDGLYLMDYNFLIKY